MERNGENERGRKGQRAGGERKKERTRGGEGLSDRESSAAFPVSVRKASFLRRINEEEKAVLSHCRFVSPVGRMLHLLATVAVTRSASSCNLTDYSGNSSSVSRLFSSTRRRKISRDFAWATTRLKRTRAPRLCANGRPHRIFHAIQFLSFSLPLLFFPFLFLPSPFLPWKKPQDPGGTSGD